MLSWVIAMDGKVSEGGESQVTSFLRLTKNVVKLRGTYLWNGWLGLEYRTVNLDTNLAYTPIQLS